MSEKPNATLDSDFYWGGIGAGFGYFSDIVSRRPRRLAYGRRIKCMRRRVIVDLASAGPLEVKFIITLRRKHARYRVPTV
jgi:hypothetical protein